MLLNPVSLNSARRDGQGKKKKKKEIFQTKNSERKKIVFTSITCIVIITTKFLSVCVKAEKVKQGIVWGEGWMTKKPKKGTHRDRDAHSKKSDIHLETHARRKGRWRKGEFKRERESGARLTGRGGATFH